MKFKSHTPGQILDAILNHQIVCELDTGNDGNDDVLIGHRSECLEDLCHYYNFYDLPDHWELEHISREEFKTAILELL